ncbi:DEAD/DEAH box helicase family protein [Streptococcus sp. HF-1907]|uniref:DEAD/DEAH box helicase family protein n=1 Tax=Streptococcus sp. HF-1907 TaxID=2785793 RepID=UPI00189F8BE3|nr:DEAD/DEAH box helicase family protein [Streptococcus sp. HF-1907]MBF7093882.1 DEAD/DEAH box helicase family protein [Streptococcus sp. HF-1907]
MTFSTSDKVNVNREIKPVIYAYTTPDNPKHNGWIKIGDTIRDADTRIKEQTHTAGLDYQKLWVHPAFLKSGKYFRDHAFHRYLAKHDIEREAGHEWFYFNGHPERAEELYYSFVGQDYSKTQQGKQSDYVLRAEQAQAVSQTMAYFEANPNSHYQKLTKYSYLWNAKPRFGKTLSTYDLVQQMDLQSVLIVTNRPAIANSWYDDFDQFVAGKTDYKFVSESDSLKNRSPLSYDNFKTLAMSGADNVRLLSFVSLQDLKGSVYFGGAYDKLKWIADLKWGMLVIDEAHEGVDTFKTDKAFDRIDRKYTLHLSGTPFKALAQGKFDQEQIYNWSYADEQEAKMTWDAEQEDENPYEDLPRLNMFTYQMSKMIIDDVKQGADLGESSVDFAFDLNEFFATNDSGKFIHDAEVDKWLDTLTHNEKYPFSTKKLRDELKHTFWLLDRVASAKALKKKLEEHPTFERYEIILAAGDGKDDNNDSTLGSQKSLDKVRKAVKEFDRTITLSVGQLTTGVTIKEWSAVLMLSNLKSPAQYMQAAFRAQNPYTCQEGDKTYKKENAYIFDFAPERTLIIFDEFANNLSIATAGGGGTSVGREENIKRLLNFFPVIAEDRDGQMMEVDASQVLTIPRQIKAQEVIKRGFMSNFLFDNISGIFSASQTVLDILESLPEEKEGKVRQTDGMLDFSGVSVDENGDVTVSEEMVINKQEVLFGTKIYELESNVDQLVEDSIETSSFVKDIAKTFADAYADEIKSSYQLNKREEKTLNKQIEETISRQMASLEHDRKTDQSILEQELTNNLKEAKDDLAKQEEIKQSYEAKRQEIDQDYKESVKKQLEETAREMPKQLVHDQEVKEATKVKKTAEEDVRAHLRGFARTIPSFIMAYGDESLTLANFDSKVNPDVFHEVTGITVEKFSLLRDGGLLEGEAFAGHLFDESTFNEAIQEFLRKKAELSNYFEETEEDIFDYIPPQKTNQIFTPKAVVKKMVTELESENPGIYDDSSKTFFDPYMKSGLYITEIVKRLYNSPIIKAEFPNDHERLKHILENQVYGLAPSEIIYRIATNFIFGNIDETISRKNFVQKDSTEAAMSGTMQELVDDVFGE